MELQASMTTECGPVIGGNERNACILCSQSLEDGQAQVTLRQKGSDGINAASKVRLDNIVSVPGQIVHVKCRKLYCKPNDIKRAINKKKNVGITSPSLRSNTETFQFSKHCLFCAQLTKCEGSKRGYDVYPVRTIEFKRNVEKNCIDRNDKWAAEVKCRLEIVNDLPAADAIYHQSCSVNFRTGKDIPIPSNEKKKKCGRPVNMVQEFAFQEVAEYLVDNDDEQITLKDLVDKMKTLCGELSYTPTHMKKRLLDHFGSSIVVTEIDGKHNVITFRNTASSILQSFYQKSCMKSTADKNDIIKTAAKLMLADIKEIQASKLCYPVSDCLMSTQENIEYIPDSLKLFLREIFSEKKADVKIASIGQAIMQAARPKVLIPPLQIGLGVQMHHHFASKLLIDMLNKLGFCCSYQEVQRFESSAAVSQGIDLPCLKDGQFCQFVADNVDHNIRTLDGHNTFHGMGIIACYTPTTQLSKTIPRMSVSAEDLVALGKIKVYFYNQENNFMIHETFRELPDFRYEDCTQNVDQLSKYIWPFEERKQGWSGIMQMVQKGSYSGKSSIVFLPMIDLNASDVSCIYSTLTFVCTQAKRLNTIPVLTFDQPLYWKALNIVVNEPSSSSIKSVVLRLGGFHTIMSFLGCIGHLMAGSGLAELLESIYAPNAVVHMLTGKAISRATRAHFLLDEVLNALLLTKTLNISLPGKEVNLLEDSCDDDIETLNNVEPNAIISKLVDLYQSLMKEEKPAKEVCHEEVFKTLKDKIDKQKLSMHENRTSRLWIMYMGMVDLLRKFIKAERIGCWELHLQAVKEMLPYFAAAGHNLYLKSAYIYLQNMAKLNVEYPDIFIHFNEGNHVVRRSDRYWAGLSTDLVIEQVLMRSVKTTGGLTRGRGLTEAQRNQWLLSMPACTDYNNAMQEFANVSYYTSDQHVETCNSRLARDQIDKTKLLNFMRDKNPFVAQESALRNIETGLTADTHVNVDTANEVGKILINNMVGKNVLEYSFKRSSQAVTLNSKSSVRVNGETVQIDPQLLFQRLTAAADRLYDNQEEIFKYELCSFPSSLFEGSGLLRQADKPSLANAIWALGDCSFKEQLDGSFQYVQDGGSLLQRLPWKYGDTFREICEAYVDHVIKKGGSSSIVVFDGYANGPSTKDCAHQKRSKGVFSTKVHFTIETPFRSKKEHFLSNIENKQSFIDMLSQSLQENGCRTIHALGDADVLIVQTAISCAVSKTTVVLGEDTDLLVLLCHHANVSSNNIYFISGRKQINAKLIKRWDITRTKNILGLNLCGILPVVHAFTGCDTTSKVFGIGKAAALKRIKSNPFIQEQSLVFLNNTATQEDISAAGEIMIVNLYGGSAHEALNSFRYRKFVNKVMTSTKYVPVNTLPPTCSSAYYHSLRVFLQVQEWVTIENSLNPLEWGWKSDNGLLMPVQTNMPPAPEELLKIIRCSCKTNCDTKRCTCRRHGLDCSSGCGECRGISCANTDNVQEQDLVEEGGL